MDKPMSDRQVRQFVTMFHRLDGNVTALTAVVRSLLREFPDREASAQRANDEIERAVAALLPTTLPDALLEGVEQTRKLLLGRLIPQPPER